MLGFNPIASTPLSAMGVGKRRIILTDRIPVEVLATVHTIIEQIDMPIEIEAFRTDATSLKWVLRSRGQQWVMDTQTLKWVLNSKDNTWLLNETSTKWTFNPQTMKWTVT